ncbi:MAG: DUF6351 family protein [Actinomycetota bacterium]|nr:DUF6351 family protein [Actinomycetota bacterium]
MRRRGWIIGVVLAWAAVLAADVPAVPAEGPSSVDADWHTLRTPPLGDGQFELLTRSTLPDMVTGGDVLLAVRGLAPDEDLRVSVGGRDVSAAFTTTKDDERLGLVEGLPLGPSTVEARAGDQVARLVIHNHPVAGPVISGPHQEPFECRTDDVGLGQPLDDDCSIAPVVEWRYRSSSDQAFHPLADPYGPYPDDVATVQTRDGAAVPFVVRIESRTINRGIARIAVLDDPAARGPDAPFDANRWNQRVYHAFGESCGVGYTQGTNSVDTVLGTLALDQISADNLLLNLVGINDRLGKGDAVVHSTLTSFGVHCNPLVSIETATMIKEHLNERYGLVEAVVGTNGSGAALQQYNAGNNAPGLLSAAMPTATFADIATTAITVTDCGLLQHYYATTGLDWTPAQQAAVNGHNLLTGTELNAICQSWTDAFLDRIDPSSGCRVPVEARYHPDTNPTGARCTIQDANVNLFGRDPATGFARRPLDNVGVQYGLAALRAGTITLQQFIDLNRAIGGFDIDGRFVPERHEMSSELASLVYRVGGVIGRGALAETPVLDNAPYLDLIPVANIHEAVRPFVIRARLRNQTGQDATQAIWRGVLTQADTYPAMESWLDATLANRPAYGGDHVAAVTSSKPAALADRCSFGTVGGRLELPAQILAPLGLAQAPLLPGTGIPDLDIPLRVDVPEDFDSGLGPCSLLLPVTSTPRMVAGMPLSDDVIKCQRRAIDAADYPGAAPEELAEIAAIFPDGVCDYSKPAAEDVERSMQWVSIGADTVEEPHELTWRVARSVIEPVEDTGGGLLPATGGSGIPWTAAATVASATVLLALRRRLSRG